jgi:CRP-like cAMP-binding protein
MSEKPKRQGISFSLDESQFHSLVNSIQNLVKVYAVAQIKPEGRTDRNARFLKVFGLTDQEIADLLGITRQGVSKALRTQRRESKGQKGSNDTVTKTQARDL